MTKPFDRIITTDFETRWDKKEYTLSKMTTEEYIRDKRFKAFGACVHEFGSSSPIEWVRGSSRFRAPSVHGRKAEQQLLPKAKRCCCPWRCGHIY